MRKFNQISTSFWSDSFILDCIPEEKGFLLYLLTNSRTNTIGCYEIPMKIMEVETGYHREMIEKVLGRLENAKKIKYSKNTGEILILNWYKYNWIKSKTVLSCILSDLSSIKEPLFKGILEGKIQNTYSDIDTLSIPHEYPRGDKDKDKDITTSELQKVYFEEFYKAYPKKKAVERARKAFYKLKADRTLLDKMLLALENQKKTEQWQKDNGQFIPYPASWLNSQMWEDAMAVDMTPIKPLGDEKADTVETIEVEKAFATDILDFIEGETLGGSEDGDI